MPNIKQIKSNGVVYYITPDKLSDGTHNLTMPTLTTDAVIQTQLVSGTNIKTVNNNSLLGSGDVSIETHVPLVSTQVATTVTIDPYKMYSFGSLSGTKTVAFNTIPVPSGYCAEYSFRFVAGSNCSITLPSGCLYNGGSAPTLTLGHTYEYNIVDNYVVVGEFY